jgi:hypothetical protein
MGRLSGSDRYSTAVAISQKGWETSDYAVWQGEMSLPMPFAPDR